MNKKPRKKQLKEVLASIQWLCTRKGDQPVISGKKGDNLAKIRKAIKKCFGALARQETLIGFFADLSQRINGGQGLEPVLQHAYCVLRKHIPFDRMGLMVVDEKGLLFHPAWTRSELPVSPLASNFCLDLFDSSVKALLQTKKPEIMPDLEHHLAQNPNSKICRMLVSEGMGSHLTCPIVADSRLLGLLFLSSTRKEAFPENLENVCMQFAFQLSLLIMKIRTTQNLADLTEFKNQFLGVAVHDFRGPLAFARRSLEMLRDGTAADSEEDRKKIQLRLQTSLDRMTQKVQELLDEDAIESGHLLLNLSVTDMNHFLRESCAINLSLIRHRKIDIDCDLPGDLPPLFIDPVRFSQVLDSLFEHAAKCTLPGREIRFHAKQEAKGIWIHITDQGPGISPEELNNVFKSGPLGLAIAKKIVKLHEGEIRVKSELGKGSTFSVYLPQKIG